jgi:hypothetical protein
VLPGVCQCTAQILTAPAEVAVYPTDAVDRVFVFLHATFAAIVWVERNDLKAFIALQQNVGEYRFGVARSDLSERR